MPGALKQDLLCPWTTTSAVLVKPAPWSDLAEQNICKDGISFCQKIRLVFVKCIIKWVFPRHRDTKIANRLSLEGRSLWGRMKFLHKQEHLKLPYCRGACDGKWSLVLHPFILFWSALTSFPHCLLDPPCPRTHPPDLLLKARVRENLSQWSACLHGFDWEM